MARLTIVLVALCIVTRVTALVVNASDQPRVGHVELSGYPAAWEDLEYAQYGSKAANKESAGQEKGADSYVRVIRETIHYPIATASPTKEKLSEVIPPLTENAPNIVTTLGKLRALRPIFDYAIHHPLRALYRYAIPWMYQSSKYSVVFTFRASWVGIIYLFTWLTFFFSPGLSMLDTIVVQPFLYFYDIFLSLLPLWLFLGGAVAIGACMGALAGFTTGQSSREWIDEVQKSGQTAVQALGQLLDEGERKKAELTEGLKKVEATWEKIESKGKGKAMDAAAGYSYLREGGLANEHRNRWLREDKPSTRAGTKNSRALIPDSESGYTSNEIGHVPIDPLSARNRRRWKQDQTLGAEVVC